MFPELSILDQMKRTIALIYQSNQRRNLESPYRKAVMTIIGPAITLFLLMCWALKVYPFGQLSATFRLLIVVAVMYLLYTVFSIAFKETELAKYQFSEVEIKKATAYVKLCNAASMIIVLIVLGLLSVRWFNALG